MQKNSQILLNTFKRFQKQLRNYQWFFFNPYSDSMALFTALSKPFEEFFLFFCNFFLILLDVPYQSPLYSILAISANMYMMLISPILLVISAFSRLFSGFISPVIYPSLKIQDTTEYKALQQLISEISMERQKIFDQLNNARDEEHRKCMFLISQVNKLKKLTITEELSIQLSSLSKEINTSIKFLQPLILSQKDGNEWLSSSPSSLDLESSDSLEVKLDKISRYCSEISNHHQKYKLWAESIFSDHASVNNKLENDIEEFGNLLKKF
jgi:hypothetical protein